MTTGEYAFARMMCYCSMLAPSVPVGYTRLQDNQILRIGKHD